MFNSGQSMNERNQTRAGATSKRKVVLRLLALRWAYRDVELFIFLIEKAETEEDMVFFNRNGTQGTCLLCPIPALREKKFYFKAL
jgi:hypothetical protein